MSPNDESIKALALELAIKAFCPKTISAPHIVESAKVFEAYIKGSVGETLDAFVPHEVVANA